jgi:hypothetical protein
VLFTSSTAAMMPGSYARVYDACTFVIQAFKPRHCATSRAVHADGYDRPTPSMCQRRGTNADGRAKK